MKEKLAIEWLIEQLQAPCRIIPSHIIEEAIQMDMRQREIDYTAGTKLKFDTMFPKKVEIEDGFIQHYIQTYK